jgi:hypothetical protein
MSTPNSTLHDAFQAIMAAVHERFRQRCHVRSEANHHQLSDAFCLGFVIDAFYATSEYWVANVICRSGYLSIMANHSTYGHHSDLQWAQPDLLDCLLRRLEDAYQENHNELYHNHNLTTTECTQKWRQAAHFYFGLPRATCSIRVVAGRILSLLGGRVTRGRHVHLIHERSDFGLVYAIDDDAAQPLGTLIIDVRGVGVVNYGSNALYSYSWTDPGSPLQWLRTIMVQLWPS